jgi:hypothetical protein
MVCRITFFSESSDFFPTIPASMLIKTKLPLQVDYNLIKWVKGIFCQAAAWQNQPFILSKSAIAMISNGDF